MKKILITGATGFLGNYLVKKLLDDTNFHLFLIIRGGPSEVREKYQKLLKITGTENSRQITVLKGDLEKPFMGLHADLYSYIAHEVTDIYHLASNQDKTKNYQELYQSNVYPVKTLESFAKNGIPKILHFVSDYNIFGDKFFTPGLTLNEESFDIGQDFSSLGYQQSKFEAEKIIRSLNSSWIIYRPGLLHPDSSTGYYPQTSKRKRCFFYDFLKLSLESEVLPLSKLKLNMTPVDYVVEALFELSQDPLSNHQTFNLLDPQPWSLKELGEKIEEISGPLTWLTNEDYCEQALTHDSKLHHWFKDFGEALDHSALVGSSRTQKLLHDHRVVFPNKEKTFLSWVHYALKHNSFGFQKKSSTLSDSGYSRNRLQY